MGKVSLRAAGTGKYGVEVAVAGDTHPSEPTIAVVADHEELRRGLQSRSLGLPESCK